MDNLHNLYQHFSWLLPLFIFIVIWDSVWKLIGLWKSARNNQIVWFICIAIINTLGILPIVYIIMDRKKGQL
jgi:hypothetical protein